MILFLSINAFASNFKNISYETEVCLVKAQYDSSAISEDEIKNILFLVRGQGSSLSDIPLWTDYKKAKSNQMNVFSKQTKEASEAAIKKLRALKLPKDESWEKIRSDFIEDVELSQFLSLSEIDFISSRGKNPLPDKFQDKVISKKCFEKMNSLNLKNNLDQNDLIEAAVFGWGNCVNELFRKSYLASEGATLFEKIEKKHMKIFKKECDEP